MQYPTVRELHSWACRFWEAGFSIVPLVPNEKRPAISWEQYQLQRPTIGTLNQWWSARARQVYGIGAVVGIISQDVVLDFDPTPDSTVDQLITEAENHFSSLLGKQFTFAETCRVASCGGAYHDHYSCRETIPTTQIFKGSCGHIEFRGDDSIIVMPPTVAVSKRTGDQPGAYSFIRGLEDRVPWETTELKYLLLPGSKKKVETPLGDEPSMEEFKTCLEQVKNKLSTKVVQALTGLGPAPGDRSGHCFHIGSELVRAGIRDPRTLAILLNNLYYHVEKYGERSGTSQWGNWGHACKLVDKVLEGNPIELPPKPATLRPEPPELDETELVPTPQAKTTSKKTPQEVAQEALTPEYDALDTGDVTPEDPEFLINPYIPIGELTLLDGDPGTGKSFAALALCAGLTGSKLCPVPYDHTAPKDAKILILTTEDSVSKTIVNRLDKMGANRKGHIFVMYRKTEKTAAKNYRDVEGITAGELEYAIPVIQRIQPNLIVIDPITLYSVGNDKYDSNNSVKVRELLNQIKALSRDLNCGLLVIRHFRKQGSATAIHRGSGSVDFAATARSVMVVGAHPEDPNTMCIGHAKSSLDVKGPTLMYQLVHGGEPPLQWVGSSCEIKAESITDTDQNGRKSDDKVALQEAENFLKEELKDGRVISKDIMKRAKDLHIAESALKKAKVTLQIRCWKDGNNWYMELPQK